MLDDDRTSLQRLVDALFAERGFVDHLDVVIRAEIMDLPGALDSVIGALPPGGYSRQRLCDQLNSSLVGHGLSREIATVD